MNGNSNNWELAAMILRRELNLTNVQRKVFPLGPAAQDEIVTTNRFILILHGSLRYTIEGRSVTMRSGTQFLVPAWVRRVWSVPRGGPCEIIWCEFEESGGGGGRSGLLQSVLQREAFRREKCSYGRLMRMCAEGMKAGNNPCWRSLLLEAELKSMLVRFLKSATGAPRSNPPLEQMHPSLQLALRWAEEHFREANALEAFHRASRLSRNYFGLLFNRAMKCSPHAYLERMRMRHARYLLHETGWQLKRIAYEVGYEDPLYFSRIYRRHWKKPPSAERKNLRGRK